MTNQFWNKFWSKFFMTKRQVAITAGVSIIAGSLTYLILHQRIELLVEGNRERMTENGVDWIVMPVLHFAGPAGLYLGVMAIAASALSYWFWFNRDQARRAGHEARRTGPRRFGPSSV